jgi:transposase
LGKWNSVYRRYRRWAVAGGWEVLRQTFEKQQPGYWLIDSTIIKAPPHAAGASKRGVRTQRWGAREEGFRPSFTRWSPREAGSSATLLTGGEVNDITQAKQLVSAVGGRGVICTGVIGDRAYDSNEFVSHLQELELEVVIPSRANRVVPRRIDAEIYRRRNVIERWFGRLKQFRRIATRYDKTQGSYCGFIALGAAQMALSGWGA